MHKDHSESTIVHRRARAYRARGACARRSYAFREASHTMLKCPHTRVSGSREAVRDADATCRARRERDVTCACMVSDAVTGSCASAYGSLTYSARTECTDLPSSPENFRDGNRCISVDLMTHLKYLSGEI